MDIFGPFDLMPDQKTMRTSCLGGFSVMLVTNLLLYPLKTAKFGPKYGFLVILGQILAYFVPCLTKPMQSRCLGVFSVMWVLKFLLSRPNLAWNWHLRSFWARLWWLIWCPVGVLVGGCGERAVSRKTPIYFIGSSSDFISCFKVQSSIDHLVCFFNKPKLNSTFRLHSDQISTTSRLHSNYIPTTFWLFL